MNGVEISPRANRETGAPANALLALADCTGWKAVHRLASRFPDAFVPSTVDTTITLSEPAARIVTRCSLTSR